MKANSPKINNILRLSNDCTTYIATFLNSFDLLYLIRSCKKLHELKDWTRLKIVSNKYPFHTLPADPTIQWQQLCVDWFTSQIQRLNRFDQTQLDYIKIIENDIKYCRNQLKAIRKKRITRHRPIYLITTNRMKIKANEKLLNENWSKMSDAFHQCTSFIWWLTPTGFMMDIPKQDPRLYGDLYHPLRSRLGQVPSEL